MNQVVLITGVAGGIGSATAKVFAEAGWHVIGVDYHEIRDLRCVHHFIQADISDIKATENIFVEVTENEGQLDALINNAAIQINKPIVEMTLDEWDKVMAVNLRSVYLTTKYAYELMCKKGGTIVNVSSVHALATSANVAAYAASKGALLALTRALAIELGQYKIRVNAVLPGAIDTPMLHEGLSRGHVRGYNTQELVQALGKKHVIGRVGQPKEIAQAVLFLADNDRSSFMTGQALVIDGGATARLSTE